MSNSFRAQVLEEVQAEMDRTDDNLETPGFNDYVADLVRRLNNLLPDRERFFEGDYSNEMSA